jgi:hypothetical protein
MILDFRRIGSRRDRSEFDERAEPEGAAEL